jgi:arginase
MSAPIQLILVPYDSGHRDARMGRGPEHLLRHGAGSILRSAGHEVSAEYVETDDEFRAEIATHFDLCRHVAERVGAARAEGRRPIVLSGNCGIALGTTAGLGAADDLAVVWLDAHGELNTPESTATGFLDGMGLAVMTGRCWRAMAERVPGHRPLADERLLLLGARDLDEAEAAILGDGGPAAVSATAVQAEGMRQALGPPLDGLASRARRAYLHVDLDVLDPLVGRANAWAPAGGLSRGELLSAVRMVAERLPLAGVGVASYDPAHDADGTVFGAAVALLDLAAELPWAPARGAGAAG